MVVEDKVVSTLGASEIVQRMLFLFDQRQVRYCHWKSNEHAVAAIRAETDLDLLFDENQEELVTEILQSLGFRFLKAVEFASYPGIVDFVALDCSVMRMVHVHAHFRLQLGEKFVKSYRLPWERTVLETRIRHESCEMYSAKPELEMLLLLVRGALKLRWRSRLAALVRKRRPSADFVREFEWLRQRIDLEQLRTIASTLLGASSAEAIVESVKKGPKFEELLRLRTDLVARVKQYRTVSSTGAFLCAVRRELLLYWRLLLRRKLNYPVPVRRTNPRGGMVIAFLGVDGSGKSTIVKELTRVLSQKVDVVNVYFGTGDGASGLVKQLKKLRERRLYKSKKLSQAVAVPKRRGMFYRPLLVVWALAAAWEKRSVLKRMLKARRCGQVVVCDRYPQSQFAQIGDGPILQQEELLTSSFMRLFAGVEAAVYRSFSVYVPDLVVKLKVSATTASTRKPGQPSMEMLRRKIEIVEALHFDSRVAVVTIDTERPLDDVLRDIGNEIWARYP
jgi:thymidylate kinase